MHQFFCITAQTHKQVHVCHPSHFQKDFRAQKRHFDSFRIKSLFSCCFPSELPLNFLTPLTDVQVYEKDEARFEVEVSRTPKTFRWLKGSQDLESDKKHEMIQEGKMYVLVIRSAAYDDEAKYMFEAEDKRTTGKLVIQGEPCTVVYLLWQSQTSKPVCWTK